MATLGTTTTPTAGFQTAGSDGWAAASSYTMPTGGGIVTSITGYFDAFSETGKLGWLMVWDNSGNILVQSASFTVNNTSGGAGGQDWWTKSISNVYVPAGTIWIGFYCNGNLRFSSEVGGASQWKSMGTGGPGSFSGHSNTTIGTVGAQITYTPGGVGQIWNGTSWLDGTAITIWNGSSWVQANPQVWNGTSWVVTT